VHERKGVYANADFSSGAHGLFVGEDIDLRLFMRDWKYGFAVTESAAGKDRLSLQFFNGSGDAVHKIYVLRPEAQGAYAEIVAKYRADDQSPEQSVDARPARARELPDGEIDVAGFQQAWLDLKDTHDFFPLLMRFRVGRRQAMRLAPAGHAVEVDAVAVRKAIEGASAQNLPIMVFVGNTGCIQIHTGPVNKLLDHEGWFNVMDPDFNLHLREGAIADAFVVRKPTVDGMVTSVEAYTADGELIVTLFGKRKPGIPEDENWRRLAQALQDAHATAKPGSR
jgi:putative hemin transport protein